MARKTVAKPKTAVVVIHGMGEQWPMETLRGFVQAVWTSDPDIASALNHQIYSKPDAITGSFELRRITTRDWSGRSARRVDFFEFYWAHMMQGNTLPAVTGWLKRLLIRSPGRVPKRLTGDWLAGLILFLAASGLSLISAINLVPQPEAWKPLSALLGVVVAGVTANWLLPVLGDAARYLSPAPGNVAARQAVREAGISLLNKLHQSGEYDRIIVVGHSLGSVVGYDVLNYAWGRVKATDLQAAHVAGSPLVASLDALEVAARTLAAASPPAGALTAYRTAQREYFKELSKSKDSGGAPLWLVSDYITLGCPLSSSDVLMAKDEADLKAKKALRDLPSNPPWLEEAPSKAASFSYPPGATARIPHHAAVFAPTVWTNVFFPHALGLLGDFISGPVAPLLGPGVRDVRVPIGGFHFRHLAYWSHPEKGEPWIPALRRAVNLRGYDEATLWGLQADSPMIAAQALPARITPPPSPRARRRSAP